MVLLLLTSTAANDKLQLCKQPEQACTQHSAEENPIVAHALWQMRLLQTPGTSAAMALVASVRALMPEESVGSHWSTNVRVTL
mmetsp:Transcript_30392/g.66582  ORF Transcript_30392/g.66582 Transcript_30392/m.66582 type:complete len:83 (-) Transcript_30392:1879-2127(-)